MIYLLFACYCVFFVASWAQVRRIGKHDDVLFPFCQLRRDVMRYRYESLISGSLSHKETESLRRLSRMLDTTIRNYNQHKTVMFDIRKVAKYLKQYRHTIKQSASVDLTENTEIKNFHIRFVRCFAKAFLEYTPLIRSEMVLRLIAFAYRAGKQAGARRISEYVIDNARKVRNDAHRDGLLGDGAAA